MSRTFFRFERIKTFLVMSWDLEDHPDAMCVVCPKPGPTGPFHPWLLWVYTWHLWVEETLVDFNGFSWRLGPISEYLYFFFSTLFHKINIWYSPLFISKIRNNIFITNMLFQQQFCFLELKIEIFCKLWGNSKKQTTKRLNGFFSALNLSFV